MLWNNVKTVREYYKVGWVDLRLFANFDMLAICQTLQGPKRQFPKKFEKDNLRNPSKFVFSKNQRGPKSKIMIQNCRIANIKTKGTV